MLEKTESLPDIVAQADELFCRQFGCSATHVAAAPGRVNLIGEHIDYCDGFVLPFAINRYVVIAARPTTARRARLFSSHGGELEIVELDQPLVAEGASWTHYVRGVLQGFRAMGVDLPGFDAVIVSSLPMGAGLSSSAALECAVATLVESLVGLTLEPVAKALLCQKAEHDFARVPCGIMDQFASTIGAEGELVFIDCQSQMAELVPLRDETLTVLIANTCVSHQLSDGGYAARRRATEMALLAMGKASWREVTPADVQRHWYQLADPVNRRARHVVSEIQRTVEAVECLKHGKWTRLGVLMRASHVSLRDDFEVSCEELDMMVEIAETIGTAGGVIGARMTGGGFGGSTVTLCQSDAAESVAATLFADYQRLTGVTPQIFASRPSRGAHVLRRG